GSMALLADGVHMATHAGALTIAGAAYWFARRHVRNERFTFGTGKVGDLAGFSSAMILAAVAVAVVAESVQHLAHPVPIAYNEAIFVASLGLVVNLVSAWLLKDDPSHHHGHDGEFHEHDDHEHHDHRLAPAGGQGHAHHD